MWGFGTGRRWEPLGAQLTDELRRRTGQSFDLLEEIFDRNRLFRDDFFRQPRAYYDDVESMAFAFNLVLDRMVADLDARKRTNDAEQLNLIAIRYEPELSHRYLMAAHFSTARNDRQATAQHARSYLRLNGQSLDESEDGVKTKLHLGKALAEAHIESIIGHEQLNLAFYYLTLAKIAPQAEHLKRSAVYRLLELADSESEEAKRMYAAQFVDEMVYASIQLTAVGLNASTGIKATEKAKKAEEELLGIALALLDFGRLIMPTHFDCVFRSAHACGLAAIADTSRATEAIKLCKAAALLLQRFNQGDDEVYTVIPEELENNRDKYFGELQAIANRVAIVASLPSYGTQLD